MSCVIGHPCPYKDTFSLTLELETFSSAKEAIARGRYGWWDMRIAPNFPFDPDILKRRRRRIKLFSFDAPVTVPEVETFITSHGYKPTGIEIFLALGAGQEVRSIPCIEHLVCLGASTNGGGLPYSNLSQTPVIRRVWEEVTTEDDPDRKSDWIIDLGWKSERWGSGTFFPALSKK